MSYYRPGVDQMYYSTDLMKHISTALNTESMVPIQMFFPVFSRRGLSFMKAVIIFMYLWECFYRQFHF